MLSFNLYYVVKDRRHRAKMKREWEKGFIPAKAECPSIFLAWIRAKKEKVCPIIEIVK